LCHIKTVKLQQLLPEPAIKWEIRCRQLREHLFGMLRFQADDDNLSLGCL
jgi:hypothetical protein